MSILRERKLYSNSCFSWSPPDTLPTRLAAQALCLTFHSDVYAKKLFSYKMEKESKEKCLVKTSVQMYLICLQIFQPGSNNYRLWTFLSSSCPMQTETHSRSAGFIYVKYPSELNRVIFHYLWQNKIMLSWRC